MYSPCYETIYSITMQYFQYKIIVSNRELLRIYVEMS